MHFLNLCIMGHEEKVKAKLNKAHFNLCKDVLNKQTFDQFKSYAEQQYPDNPDQQAVLIRQLQEQHYYQYMQQVSQLCTP